VTASTQGAIQVTSVRLGLKCAHYFGQQNGLVGK
jgi:hypothetical protein